MTEDCVTVYTDCDFQGESHQLQPGLYNINYPTVRDNTISSISIPIGWTVTIYADNDFMGESKELTKSAATLGDFNDKISSIRINHGAISSDKLKGSGDSIALTTPLRFGSLSNKVHNVEVFAKIAI